MRHPIKGERTAHRTKLSEPNELAPESTPGVRHSSCFVRKVPESYLLDLAVRLSSELPLSEAQREVLAALAAVLPHCQSELLESGHAGWSADGTATTDLGGGAQSRTMECLGRRPSIAQYEWRIPVSNPQLTLLISVDHPTQSQSTSCVAEVGELIAQLLSSVILRERTRQRLLSQTEEFLDLRRRVIQAEKLAGYGQLVASVLHDLNNPLTAILAYTDYLNRTLRNSNVPQSDLERLSRIGDAANAVLRQTRGLVEYACPPRPRFTRVDLTEVVKRASALCEHEFARAGIAMRTNLDARLPQVAGHAEQLTQLFVNLFTNAAHAARADDAWIAVDGTAHEGSRRLCILVRDNGSGIQPGDLAHVFDPFYTTKHGRGCGLGLSIVKEIARHHGGEVTVESAPTVGTTFCLVLPLAQGGEDVTTDAGSR